MLIDTDWYKEYHKGYMARLMYKPFDNTMTDSWRNGWIEAERIEKYSSDELLRYGGRRKYMTNKEWLATLSPDEWYMKVYWLFHEYGKRYTDTYIAVREWLEEKHID